MDGDLQRVAGRLTGLALKRPGFALGVYGPPGIGKTHTVLGLLRGAQCRSVTVHATQPLEGVVVLQLPHPKKPSAWLERGLERLRGGEALTAEAIMQTLAGVLSANAPFILHVEDLHESSRDRLEFWTQLALMIPRLRGVALIVTTRIQPPAPLEMIGLPPLTREASDALLESEAGAALPREALEWIFDHALGNPLFSLEFFRFLARQGTLWNDGHRWRWRTPQTSAMPVTIEALIERMLGEAASTPTLERAIGARAVLGIDAPSALWASVAELTPQTLELASANLERLGVFANGDFAHPLYREVALGSVTLEQRRSLARRAIKYLADDPRAAAGFVGDAGLEASVALQLLERAAQMAQDAGNAVQAARCQAAAVEYATGERRASLAFKASEGLRRVDIPEATRLAALAQSIRPNHSESVDLLAHLLAAQGKLSDANRVLAHSLPNEPSVIGGALRQLKVFAAAHDQKAVIELWRQHPELSQNPEPGVAYIAAHALVLHGMQLEAEQIAMRALEQSALEPRDHCQLLSVLGSVRYFQCDYAGAENFYQRAVELAHHAQRPDLIAVYLANRATARGEMGRLNERIADMREAISLHREAGNATQVVRCQTALADALLDAGCYEQTEELLLECRDALRQSEVSEYLIECEYRLSQLYRDWGLNHGGVLAIKHASAALERARLIANPRKIAWSLCYLAIAEARFGNAGRSQTLATEALSVATQLQSIGQIGMARFAQALALEALGQRDFALCALRELQQHLVAQDLTDPAQEIGLEIDRVSGDATSAAARLEWFEAHDLKNMANIARRYFPELARDTAITPALLEPQSTTRLEVLGALQVSLGGATTPMRGRKRQELLALLLEARIAGRGEVSKLELMDALYPDADELQSSAGLRDVVYQLRLNLSDGAITTTANGYALGNIGSDLEEFLKSGDTSLWRGAYLQGLTLSGSDTVFESVYLALRSRAEALLHADPVEATRVGRLLCEADPYDLEAVRLTLAALRIGGNHRSLSRVYEQARMRFSEIGESLPAAWQDFLTSVGANP